MSAASLGECLLRASSGYGFRTAPIRSGAFRDTAKNFLISALPAAVATAGKWVIRDESWRRPFAT